VYDTSDGKRMTHVAPIKVSAPVRACGLSPDCRHLLAVIGNGFIFRFEYRKPDAEVTRHASVQRSAMYLFVHTEQLHMTVLTCQHGCNVSTVHCDSAILLGMPSRHCMPTSSDN